MRFKIDWASLIVGRKFAVFALFYIVFEGNFQVQVPGGAYIWRGNLTEGFLRYEFGGLIFGGAYTWRGLFSEFYCISYPSITKKNMLTSGPRCGTWRGTVLTSNVLDRHSITVMSKAERHDEENIA